MATFNALHTGLEALINALLLSTPCAEFNIVLNPNYEVIDNRLVNPEWRVECTKPLAVTGPTTMAISFIPPTSRRDGTPLSGDDINSYELTVMGEFKGKITATVSACDTEELCSDQSEPVVAVIE